MLRKYIQSQSLAYLITGLTLISLRGTAQIVLISCLGDIFVVLGLTLGISSFSEYIMLKFLDIDVVFENMLIYFSIFSFLGSLIYLQITNEISANTGQTLIILVLVYLLIMIISSSFYLKRKSLKEQGYLKKTFQELVHITKKQVEKYAIIFFTICSLAAILSLVLQDGALLYLGIVDYISIITILAVND